MSSKEYKIHSVKYNLIMNTILKMSSFIFPLITFPYISRVLGPIGNGKVTFATSIIYYFSIIATLGIPTYGVKICAQYRDDKEKLSKTVKELLVIESVTMILSYIIFFLALKIIPRFQEEKLLMCINSLTIGLTVFGVEWFYQAIEQYDYITFRNITFKVLSIVLMFIFVKKTEDYILYGAINVLGTVGSNILNIIRLRKFVSFKSSMKLELGQHMKPIFILFLLSCSTTIYTSIDSVMLGFISGDGSVGYYNAATKLKIILVSLVSSLGVVLLPRLSNALGKNNINEFYRLIKKSFNFVLLISIPLTIFCMLEAKALILFLAGDTYMPAINAMICITPSIIFIGLTNIIGIQMLVPTGNEKLTLMSTIVGAMVNVVLNLILISRYTATGASIATTVAEFSVLLVQVFFVRNELKNIIDVKNYLKIILSATIGIVIIFLLNMFLNQLNPFSEIVLTGISFFLTYGILLLAFKEKIIFQILNNLQNKHKASNLK